SGSDMLREVRQNGNPVSFKQIPIFVPRVGAQLRRHRMRQTISVSQDGDKYGFLDPRGICGARVCARYGICRQTFYDEVKRGRIKAKKLGKKTVILRSDAEKWVIRPH